MTMLMLMLKMVINEPKSLNNANFQVPSMGIVVECRCFMGIEARKLSQ
jgi:hypothetical protein